MKSRQIYSILAISLSISVMTFALAFYRQYRNNLFLFIFSLLKYISNICDSLDIDECKRNLSSCHVNADCLNTIGSYVCRCHTGYIGDGTTCNGNSIVFFYFFSSVMKITKILQLWHAEFKSDDKNSHRVTIHSCLLQGILLKKKNTHTQTNIGFRWILFCHFPFS